MSLRPGRGGQPAEPLLAPAAVSTAPTAAVVAAWFLWVLAMIFALVAMILAAVILSRANSIQDGVNDLLACCSYVSTTVTTILSDIFAIGEFLFIEGCTPLFGPQTIDTPGCYFFVFEIECTGAGITCFPIPFTDDVTVDMRGLSLTIDSPDSAGFAPSVANNVKILNGWIMTPVASNISTSRGINAAFADNLQVINVRMTNLFRPIANLYSNGFTVKDSFIENANQQNFVGFGNRAIGMFGVNDAIISNTKLRNNNVAADAIGSSNGVLWGAVDGSPADGLIVEDCFFTDTILHVYSSGIVDGVSNMRVSDCTFSISDPLFADNFIHIGDSNNNTLNVIPVGVTIERTTFTNKNANPLFDGLVIGGAKALRITGNTISMSANGVLPGTGVFSVALIHLGFGNTNVDTAFDGKLYVSGALIADNKLVGRPNPNDTGVNTAIRVEARCSDIDIVDNRISGIAAGLPASEDVMFGHDEDDVPGFCDLDAYPAQQPAAVWVSAGARGVHVKDNKLWDGSCATGDFTVPASGIVFAPNETRSSWCPIGYGPVYFPPADNCFAEGNSVWNFCGKGIRTTGSTNSRVKYNKAHNNGASVLDNYDVPGYVVVLADSDNMRAGWNVEGPCIDC